MGVRTNIIEALGRLKDRSFQFVFLLIYCSQDTLLFGTNANRVFFWMKNLFLLLACFCIMSKPTRNLSVNIKTMRLVLFSLVVMTLLTSLVNFDITFKYVYEILLFVLAYNVIRIIDFETFKTNFVYSLYYLSLISIVLYILSLLVYPVIELMPIVKNESGYIYYSLFGLCNVSEIPMYGPMRNASLFREPGVYVIFLIIAMVFLYNMNIDKRRRNAILLVLSVAVLTTLSTAGYIGLVLLVGYLMFGKTAQIGIGSKLFIVILCIIGVNYVLSNESLYSSVFDKMSGGNDSADSRFGAISNNLEMWSRTGSSLLFGKGYQYVENNVDLVAFEKGYVSGHNTNTLFKMLSVHGISYFVLILLLLFVSCRRITCRHFSIYVMLLFCVMLSNEDLIFNQILYIILFYGLTNIGGYEKNLVSRVSISR